VDFLSLEFSKSLIDEGIELRGQGAPHQQG
jgi:hypothetical protein